MTDAVPGTQINYHNYRKPSECMTFQWLHSIAPIPHNEYGDVLQVMKARRDMPNLFVTKRYMRDYMLRAGVTVQLADRHLDAAWKSWRAYQFPASGRR